jgi:predicted RND superfamily exporter protein
MGLVTGIAILLAMFINFLVLPTLLSFLMNKDRGQIS